MRRIRSRLTYANVVASLALFIALGGGAYAATQLPKNSVGTKQLKSGAVTAAKINKDAKATLTGVGPTGPVGPQGPAGSTGAAGSARAYARVSGDGNLEAANSKGIAAVIPACQPNDPAGCSGPRIRNRSNTPTSTASSSISRRTSSR